MATKREVIYVEDGVETYVTRRVEQGSFKNRSAVFRYLLALGIAADLKEQQQEAKNGI